MNSFNQSPYNLNRRNNFETRYCTLLKHLFHKISFCPSKGIEFVALPWHLLTELLLDAFVREVNNAMQRAFLGIRSKCPTFAIPCLRLLPKRPQVDKCTALLCKQKVLRNPELFVNCRVRSNVAKRSIPNLLLFYKFVNESVLYLRIGFLHLLHVVCLVLFQNKHTFWIVGKYSILTLCS